MKRSQTEGLFSPSSSSSSASLFHPPSFLMTWILSSSFLLLWPVSAPKSFARCFCVSCLNPPSVPDDILIYFPLHAIHSRVDRILGVLERISAFFFSRICVQGLFFLLSTGIFRVFKGGHNGVFAFFSQPKGIMTCGFKVATTYKVYSLNNKDCNEALFLSRRF